MGLLVCYAMWGTVGCVLVPMRVGFASRGMSWSIMAMAVCNANKLGVPDV
jgi:hypothetical protein